MKRFSIALVAIALSCTADPHIVPDPIDASINEPTSSSSVASSSSSSASSSSSSSTSSSSGGPQGDGSGTRLKRYLYHSVDGISGEYPRRFWDSSLDIDCTPYVTIAGIRCLPMPIAIAQDFFSDAGCTVPAVVAQKQCDQVTHHLTISGFACDKMLSAKAFAINKSQSAQLFRYTIPGGCVLQSAYPQADYDIYDIGAEVDYTQFAAMTLEHE